VVICDTIFHNCYASHDGDLKTSKSYHKLRSSYGLENSGHVYQISSALSYQIHAQYHEFDNHIFPQEFLKVVAAIGIK